MKYRGLLLALGLAATLAGCTSLDRAKITAKYIGVSDQTVAKVIEGAVVACQFLPEIQVVRELFATGKYAKYANAAGAVVEDICRAATTAPLAEGPGGRKPPMIRVGKKVVVVKGVFVR